jgi:thiamine-monophosphate kinase
MESKILSLLPTDKNGTLIPIGDDCGELPWPASSLLASTDMIMDGEHFISALHSPEQIANKALGVNISDVSAMAGTPKAVLLSMAIQRRSTDFAPRFVLEFIRLCDQKGIVLLGGDTNFTDSPTTISVTILASPHMGGSIRRDGARAGDRIFVTGKLGGSLASNRHLNPPDRSKLAQQLADTGLLTSMIDISDGVASDLRHILAQSQCGAEIFTSKIPLHEDVLDFAQALTDGEDFELLFTAEIPAGSTAIENLGAIEIGVVTNSPNLFELIYDNGKKEKCLWKGFEHQ